LNCAIGLLATSILASAFFSPYEGIGSIAVQNWLKLVLFYVLLMTSIKNVDELKTLIIAFVVIMGLYELHSLREYFCGRGVYRMGIWRMVGIDSTLSDPNAFSASIVYGLPMLIPASVFVKEYWQKLAVWGLVCLGVVCILLTGSRSGLAGLLVLSFGFTMTTRHRWKILALLTVTSPLIWINISEDLQNRYLSLIDPSLGPANAQGSAESREQFFYMSVDIWKENLLLGLGPGGFANASGTGMQPHSLYAQTLSEFGTFGAIAVCVLVVGFFQNYRVASAIYRDAVPTMEVRFCYLTVCATTSAVLLLLFLGLAGHNLFRYTWIWYAAFSAISLRFLQEEAYLAEDRSSFDSAEAMMESSELDELVAT